MKVILDNTERNKKLSAAIREHYSIAMQLVAAPYSAAERETWFSQIQEADAWLADPTAATPLITSLAQSRGISLSELVTKIKENDNIFRATIGSLLGQQQAELDALYNPV